ncbi:unnamed protein product [Moneuplotes crassus]|uniref:Uncharacterized protein n=1 Tax=Euplotes crassus TaxID=5936 RepID=A0AAD1Y677_EUPCR|nr:unnamed protein product [Moneuplotes crassus]
MEAILKRIHKKRARNLSTNPSSHSVVAKGHSLAFSKSQSGLQETKVTKRMLKNALSRNQSISIADKLAIVKNYEQMKNANSSQLESTLKKLSTQLDVTKDNNTLWLKNKVKCQPKVLKLKPKSKLKKDDSLHYKPTNISKFKVLKKRNTKNAPDSCTILPNVQSLLLPSLSNSHTSKENSVSSSFNKDISDTSSIRDEEHKKLSVRTEGNKLLPLAKKANDGMKSLFSKKFSRNQSIDHSESSEDDSERPEEAQFKLPTWMTLNKNSKDRAHRRSWINNINLYKETALGKDECKMNKTLDNKSAKEGYCAGTNFLNQAITRGEEVVQKYQNRVNSQARIDLGPSFNKDTCNKKSRNQNQTNEPGSELVNLDAKPIINRSRGIMDKLRYFSQNKNNKSKVKKSLDALLQVGYVHN